MNQSMIFFYVALGGAFGACSRYYLSELITGMLGRGFPYSTLFVNVLGSFVIGLVIAAIEQGLVTHWPWRYLLSFGLLGALTTFSTFSMDNLLLMQQGEWLKMGLNILLNVFASLFATWCGFTLLIRNG